MIFFSQFHNALKHHKDLQEMSNIDTGDEV